METKRSKRLPRPTNSRPIAHMSKGEVNMKLLDLLVSELNEEESKAGSSHRWKRLHVRPWKSWKLQRATGSGDIQSGKFTAKPTEGSDNT